MKKVLLIFVLCILLSSCEKPTGGPGPDTYINISYRDQNGLDLLNSANPAYINSEDIDVYFLTPQNERRRLYNGRLDMPEMFRIDKQDNDNYYLTIFFEPDLDCVDKNNMATMYLTYYQKLDPNQKLEDKFVGKFNQKKWPRTLEKLWVNDKLVWEISSSSPRLITINK